MTGLIVGPGSSPVVNTCPRLTSSHALPSGRLEQSVAFLFENAAKDGGAAEGRSPHHLLGPDVDLPPTQVLQKGDGRSVDHQGNPCPFDGGLAHRTRLR